MSAASPTPDAPSTPGSAWSTGRVVLAVLGSLAAVLGVAVVLGGAALMIGHLTQRDADGYLTSPHDHIAATGYAVTAEGIDLADLDAGEWLVHHGFGHVRIRATGATGAPIFVGIAREAAVDRYLAGVAHSELDKVRSGPDRYTQRAGGAPGVPPVRTGLWVASASGPGTQTLDWDARDGRWAVAVMNADGTRHVGADVTVGAKLDALPWIAAALLVLGGVVLAGGAGMIGVAARGAAPAHSDAAAPAHAETGYPVRVDAEVEPGLSRWLWLVKWLLAIPHFVVLAFLWVAFLVLTIAALFAVVATGRYPRALFDFNAGVLRWTWRVAFYSYGGLGTDRYPPFTLADVDYPARLEIPYPERLSRGKALVKWWLLAIPHYLVLSVLAGNLNGLLVFFAAVALLFTGSYPADVLRLVVGINRWLFRVLAYVALMRDEYPPFRLDP
jgi:hypothetical protein